MAKVTGPLMSLGASGSVAKTITFSIWKGRPYVRELVTPSNPRTEVQVETRSYLGAIAKAAVIVLTSTKDPSHIGSLFFKGARDGAPSGQSWISWLQKQQFARYIAAMTAFTALSGTKQGYFTTAAADAGLVDYDGAPGGTFDTSAGRQLFLLCDFAVQYLTGTVQTTAETAIDPSAQGDVDDFVALVNTNVT